MNLENGKPDDRVRLTHLNFEEMKALANAAIRPDTIPLDSFANEEYFQTCGEAAALFRKILNERLEVVDHIAVGRKRRNHYRTLSTVFGIQSFFISFPEANVAVLKSVDRTIVYKDCRIKVFARPSSSLRRQLN